MMQAEIDNINHPLMLLTRDLLAVDGVKQHQQFLIDDPENIAVAIAAGIQIKQVFCYGEHAERHPEFIASLPAEVEIYPVRPRTCKKIFGVAKQARVFAIAEVPTPTPLSAIGGDMAVLDGLMMMGNIGAIVRSALAFDMGGVVLLDIDPYQLYDRRLIRSSKGYIFRLPMVCVSSEELFAHCKAEQIQVVNCSHDAEHSIDEVVSQAGRMALILGAEKSGVSDRAREHADVHAKIPYNPAVESLNVSVAAGILFYSRFRAVAR